MMKTYVIMSDTCRGERGFVVSDCLVMLFVIILWPPAGRQMTTLPMPISQQPYNRSSPNFQQLLSNKGKLVNFSSLHMGNYVNQVHHTINTGESREVKIKINFA